MKRNTEYEAINNETVEYSGGYPMSLHENGYPLTLAKFETTGDGTVFF